MIDKSLLGLPEEALVNLDLALTAYYQLTVKKEDRDANSEQTFFTLVTVHFNLSILLASQSRVIEAKWHADRGFSLLRCLIPNESQRADILELLAALPNQILSPEATSSPFNFSGDALRIHKSHKLERGVKGGSKLGSVKSETRVKVVRSAPNSHSVGVKRGRSNMRLVDGGRSARKVRFRAFGVGTPLLGPSLAGRKSLKEDARMPHLADQLVWDTATTNAHSDVARDAREEWAKWGGMEPTSPKSTARLELGGGRRGKTPSPHCDRQANSQVVTPKMTSLRCKKGKVARRPVSATVRCKSSSSGSGNTARSKTAVAVAFGSRLPSSPPLKKAKLQPRRPASARASSKKQASSSIRVLRLSSARLSPVPCRPASGHGRDHDGHRLHSRHLQCPGRSMPMNSTPTTNQSLPEPAVAAECSESPPPPLVEVGGTDMLWLRQSLWLPTIASLCDGTDTPATTAQQSVPFIAPRSSLRREESCSSTGDQLAAVDISKTILTLNNSFVIGATQGRSSSPLGMTGETADNAGFIQTEALHHSPGLSSESYTAPLLFSPSPPPGHPHSFKPLWDEVSTTCSSPSQQIQESSGKAEEHKVLQQRSQFAALQAEAYLVTMAAQQQQLLQAIEDKDLERRSVLKTAQDIAEADRLRYGKMLRFTQSRADGMVANALRGSQQVIRSLSEAAAKQEAEIVLLKQQKELALASANTGVCTLLLNCTL